MKVEVFAVSYTVEGGLTQEQFCQKVIQRLDSLTLNHQLSSHSLVSAKVIVLPELIGLDLIQRVSSRSLTQQTREIGEKLPEIFIATLKNWMRSQAQSQSQSQSQSQNQNQLHTQSQKIWLMAGSIPFVRENQIFNTAILISPEGELFLQDKLYLTPDEKTWGWSAGQKLNPISTPFGNILINICYDSEFPSVSASMTSLRPSLILIPAMTSDLQGFHRVRWCAQARSVEHFSYVVHTAALGLSTHGEPYFGGSAILNPPFGTFNSFAQEGFLQSETPLSTILDFSLLDQLRAETKLVNPPRDHFETISKI